MFDKEIIQGKRCHYCHNKTQFVDSSCIYGKSYGMIYICKPCNAYVGVHKGTKQALGIVANKELREAKKKAHYYFDNLWKRAIKNGRQKKECRSKAYKWLSKQLNIKPKYTHIGMFDVETCNKVIQICKPYYK